MAEAEATAVRSVYTKIDIPKSGRGNTATYQWVNERHIGVSLLARFHPFLLFHLPRAGQFGNLKRWKPFRATTTKFE